MAFRWKLLVFSVRVNTDEREREDRRERACEHEKEEHVRALCARCVRVREPYTIHVASVHAVER